MVFPLANAQQIALYQGNAICTAYLNGVENHLGHYIRHVVNVLLDIKKRSKQLRTTLKDQGFNTQAINQAVKEQITAPATEFKQRLASKTVDLANLSTECATVYQILAPVLECYPRDYTFTKNNRWLDIKINPKHHIKVFHRLVTFAEDHGFKLFQCFPMKHGWIPGEIIIDTTILKQHFLQEMLISKEEAWKRVVNTDKKPFKPQQGCHFRGTIYTDGVAVTIVKTDGETRAGGPRRAYKRKIGKEDQYVEKLNDQELKQLYHRSVLIDPGRRDLLYAMHEDSQPSYPIKYRYTSNQKKKDTKAKVYDQIRERVKTAAVGMAEASLGEVSGKTVDPARYMIYLVMTAKVADVLTNHYAKSRTHSGKYPLHRKLRLSSYIKRRQADDRLAASLRAKFGPSPALIFGNWSASNAKFHEPVRGVGLRRCLKSHGFQVLLIDEFRTSKICPGCEQARLEPFRRVPNPRPYRRPEQPTVLCHGLLRCTNQTCMLSNGQYRMFNRDMAAVLNFKKILDELRRTRTRPAAFRRNTNSSTTVIAVVHQDAGKFYRKIFSY